MIVNFCRSYFQTKLEALPSECDVTVSRFTLSAVCTKLSRRYEHVQIYQRPIFCEARYCDHDTREAVHNDSDLPSQNNPVVDSVSKAIAELGDDSLCKIACTTAIKK